MGEVTEKEPNIQWALDLLTPHPEREHFPLYDYWVPVTCALAGFASGMVVNYIGRRPMFSGIQTHITLTVLGAGIGRWAHLKREAIVSERDAVLRDYIRLHPEDFPEPERKKWADQFLEWVPIR
ncbi:NADH dehydrogenase [ubiquinone] 1 subunit C2 [Diprion similis]|uniref:NADH dehydrogenase [ubiquinone] 1 subunit C2 n=1 Tax=Diprion similis TaxID=362088 RepID=UPI001EF80F95|nr:NADH dehydrogenase [ubiquinone] 1 subunit C2 [Diprion similis]